MSSDWAEHLILDVGCGHSFRGTINVDLFIKATAHRSSDQNRIDDTDLDAKSIPNLVCADACSLPFRDNTFDEVFSSHTLEHTNGEKMFEEMVRVSRRLVQIVCPNRFGFKQSRKILHIYVVNKAWFIKAAQKYHVHLISCSYTDFIYIPHLFIRLFVLPKEITFIGLKQRRRVGT